MVVALGVWCCGVAVPAHASWVRVDPVAGAVIVKGANVSTKGGLAVVGGTIKAPVKVQMHCDNGIYSATAVLTKVCPAGTKMGDMGTCAGLDPLVKRQVKGGKTKAVDFGLRVIADRRTFAGWCSDRPERMGKVNQAQFPLGYVQLRCGPTKVLSKKHMKDIRFPVSINCMR